MIRPRPSVLSATVAAIAIHAALVERFIQVLGGAPFWKSICDPEYARVSIKGDEATITWPEADSGYSSEDPCSIERNDYSIPLELLFISNDELAAWKVEQRAIYDREQQERQAAGARDAEAVERATLAMLKAKYEPK